MLIGSVSELLLVYHLRLNRLSEYQSLTLYFVNATLYKGGYCMRISKEPEARKQEILETAMKLFAEKGYEKTSISDIAKEIGVAQGLCYRYFPSKDILFQTAVNEYANILVDKLKTNINIEQDSIKDILNHMEVLSESTNDTYYDTFHDEKNKTFHDLLSLSICKKLVPVVVKLIKKANVTGELNISDVESYANFCVYGQLGILTDDNRCV